MSSIASLSLSGVAAGSLADAGGSLDVGGEVVSKQQKQPEA